jgi:hypothetical protein
MSNETFPITPPPELVQKWHHVWKQLSRDKLIDFPEYMATQAARWGSDQELEACCEWLEREDGWLMPQRLRTARRPKTPSLKEQALALVNRRIGTGHVQMLNDDQVDTIRRALEQLDD